MPQVTAHSNVLVGSGLNLHELQSTRGPPQSFDQTHFSNLYNEEQFVKDQTGIKCLRYN